MSDRFPLEESNVFGDACAGAIVVWDLEAFFGGWGLGCRPVQILERGSVKLEISLILQSLNLGLNDAVSTLFQNPADRLFTASVVGLPNVKSNGTTEEVAIASLKGLLIEKILSKFLG